MRKKAKDLIFLSQIKPDGTGVAKVTESHLEFLLHNTYQKDEYYKLICLSMTNETYIAHGMNSYIVKLKKPIK